MSHPAGDCCHKPGSRLSLFSARTTVNFSAKKCNRPLASTSLDSLVNGDYRACVSDTCVWELPTGNWESDGREPNLGPHNREFKLFNAPLTIIPQRH